VPRTPLQPAWTGTSCSTIAAWKVEDRGYDAAAIRRGLRIRHIVPFLAMRRTEHGSGFGRSRWVVERTFACLNQFRRLRVRYDKRSDIHEAFLSLGCALICWQSLR
jgi:transposase